MTELADSCAMLSWVVLMKGEVEASFEFNSLCINAHKKPLRYVHAQALKRWLLSVHKI